MREAPYTASDLASGHISIEKLITCGSCQHILTEYSRAPLRTYLNELHCGAAHVALHRLRLRVLSRRLHARLRRAESGQKLVSRTPQPYSSSARDRQTVDISAFRHRELSQTDGQLGSTHRIVLVCSCRLGRKRSDFLAHAIAQVQQVLHLCADVVRLRNVGSGDPLPGEGDGSRMLMSVIKTDP